MAIHLTTPRLVLREFTAHDGALLEALDADAEVVHFITGGRPTPRAEIEDDWLPAILERYRRTPGFGFFAAELVDASPDGGMGDARIDGRFVGWFHFRPRPEDPDDVPELGYRLVRSVWDTGLASEGSIALVDKGFREQGVSRVVAETMVVHTASRRVMEKAGLRPVRFFHAVWPDHIPGDEHGDVEYAITRDEWLAQGRG
ncbi:GNAT family N-acetyltransferase [Nakamurella sp. YIM 132087]|uniref:GNAT family N-acetyltransferase n=1 Tax=Nakamurella alba TaxID=2665158 RepID=A0A7K1FJA5_9ACTN|nr:GNAT family protein [Nakamurella alba]MTD14212.1 GNAT family N-acetyltransferase [Nakamurella alba]